MFVFLRNQQKMTFFQSRKIFINLAIFFKLESSSALVIIPVDKIIKDLKVKQNTCIGNFILFWGKKYVFSVKSRTKKIASWGPIFFFSPW